MEFADISFLLFFLPVYFFLYQVAPGRVKNIVLFAGSALFYLWGEPKFLWVLPVSLVVNWCFGRLLEKRIGKWIFWIAVLSNLAVLCYFKIAGDDIPMGLSFYTFQVIAYLADVRRKELQAERSLFSFALVLMMFPKIGSGPLVSYGALRGALQGDLQKEPGSKDGAFQRGLQYFVLGLSAKVLLADRLGILWNDVQVAGYESITWRYAWIGAVAFSLKLYFDFYGYSLMAVGLGRMMGFTLPDNFSVPYLARSVRDFYRRWHITLGLWFRKYVYIPLGGSRMGEGRTVLNLLAVWLLTGFWHGVSANFFLWGIFLWCCIVFERLAERIPLVKRLRILPHVYLWLVIPISWMLFAIPDLSEMQLYLCRMAGIGEVINGNPADWITALQRHGGILLAAAVCAGGWVEKLREKREGSLWLNLILAVLFWLCIWKVMRQGSNPFLYVNF